MIYRFMIISMNKTKLIALIFSLCLLGMSGNLHAQLADTIWSGNATITIPSVTQYQNGLPLRYPKTVSNLSFILPVEVWFWDASKFLVVFRQRDFGAAPDRAPLQPAIGEWTIPVAARRGSLTGVSRVPTTQPGLFEIETGRYSAGRGGAFTFTAEQRDISNLAGFDRDWIYRGYRTLMTGSARLLNSRTLSATLTAVTTPNPGGPNLMKYVGAKPSAVVTLTKTSRRPSVTGVGDFVD